MARSNTKGSSNIQAHLPVQGFLALWARSQIWVFSLSLGSLIYKGLLYYSGSLTAVGSI